MEVKKTYIVQENGQVTLPIEWREKYGFEKGDVIVFEETEEGLLISPRQAIAMRLLDEIGDMLREGGVSLEEMVRSGREIRRKMVKDKYGLKAKSK